MTPQDEDMLAGKIITAVCSAFNVTTADLLSPSRHGRLCDARRAACHLMFESGITNARHLARHINRTYPTVYHHLETHRNIYDYAPKYRRKYESARHSLSL